MRRGSSQEDEPSSAASSALSLSTAAMRLDQNTHALVLATALMTSIAFAIFAMNLLALVLSHLLA